MWYIFQSRFWHFMPSLSFCLARGLSILLVFSKNEHMVLLIYSIIWLFSILISTLMLLSLDFICYSFYDFLRWIFRSLIFNFSSFLIYFNLINFPLTRGLAASHEFLYVLFSFHLVQNISCLLWLLVFLPIGSVELYYLISKHSEGF